MDMIIVGLLTVVAVGTAGLVVAREVYYRKRMAEVAMMAVSRPRVRAAT